MSLLLPLDYDFGDLSLFKLLFSQDFFLQPQWKEHIKIKDTIIQVTAESGFFSDTILRFIIKQHKLVTFFFLLHINYHSGSLRQCKRAHSALVPSAILLTSSPSTSKTCKILSEGLSWYNRDVTDLGRGGLCTHARILLDPELKHSAGSCKPTSWGALYWDHRF